MRFVRRLLGGYASGPPSLPARSFVRGGVPPVPFALLSEFCFPPYTRVHQRRGPSSTSKHLNSRITVAYNSLLCYM